MIYDAVQIQSAYNFLIEKMQSECSVHVMERRGAYIEIRAFVYITKCIYNITKYYNIDRWMFVMNIFLCFFSFRCC